MITYDKIKLWYDYGLWDEEKVLKAVPKYISEEQYYQIVGKESD